MKSGWLSNKLGNLCKIDLGRTPSRAQSAYWDDARETGNVWLSIADLLTAEDNVVVDSREYVTAKGAKLCKLVPKGTLLVSFKLTLGRLAFAGRDLFTNEAIAALTPLSGSVLSKEFLFYFLQFFDWVKAAEHEVKLKGMTFNKAKLKEIEVHFPAALSEQQRIVGILDAAFEGIATAKANAEQNLRNAGTLFGSYLQSVFAQPGPDWMVTSKPLSGLCDLIVDCEHKTAPTQDDGIPSIRTPNVGKGKLLLDGVKRVSAVTYKAWTRRAEPQAGDLILAREAPAGNVAVIPENTRVCLGQRTVLIRPMADTFNPYFLALRLLEPRMQEKLLAHSRGATVQHVNLKEIRALDVGAIPPLDVQKDLAKKTIAISDEADRLTCVYEEKLAALELLKKSLLYGAFTGQL